ncbi:MAG: 1-deoxy-D-xylulose-5-phosphate reductoisomerase [Planctomycetota bacterium]|nr:1-deoxy-D-xylulose-5-phosphate reductoisomerase [Planctomycetota bacterium]
MKRIALLGSTGSIGTSCLDVVRQLSDRISVVGLAAHRSWESLARQATEFDVGHVVLADSTIRDAMDATRFPKSSSVRFGADAVVDLVQKCDCDVVVSSIVGAAGLAGTWAAVEAGKTIAVANKETLVVAGPLVMAKARETGATLLPVDSEHSAIFQAMQSGKREHVKRVILTASGGPFRGYSASQLESVTPAAALNHPTWNMGPKVTIDSATLMNKALEVIEAKWLFGLEADQIEVVVHPQSLIHSLVEFADGSCVAQLSPPDMKLPIQLALTWPDRLPCPAPAMDWTKTWSMDFEPPDRDLFPCLELGFEVARRGGSCGAVLNAANEIAVQRFLNNDIRYNNIHALCRDILQTHNFEPAPSLDDLIRLDAWARKESSRWKSSLST